MPGDGCGALRRVLMVPSVLGSVAVATEWLGRAADHSMLDARTRLRLEMLINEALANVVMHAHADGSETGEIAVALEIATEQVVLQIEDDGAAFDPVSATRSPASATLADAQPSGRGLTLMRHYADQLEFERKGGRNIMRAVVSRPVAKEHVRLSTAASHPG